MNLRMNDKFLTKAYRSFSFIRSRLQLSNMSEKKFPHLDLEFEISKYRTAIVYVGLSSISANSANDAVGLIKYVFRNAENLVTPGFTPSFRKSGVYSVTHSRPETGAFSKIIFKQGINRTLDPIHSLFIMRGNLPHSDIMGETFHPDGVYKSFASQDACIINIGTPEIVSTNLHYCERFAGLPYLEKEIYKGVVILSDNQIRDVEHISYRYKNPISWNRRKIERLWLEKGCMKMGWWNGALCRVIDGSTSMSYLHSALKNDPYFMVKF